MDEGCPEAYHGAARGGTGTVETMTVTGEQPGTVRLRVRWRRRWDPPDVSKEEHLVTVTVSAA